MGISLTPPTIRGVTTSPFATYPLGLYASETYLASTPSITALTDLRQHAMIGYVDSVLDIPDLRFMDETLPGVLPVIQTNNIAGQWMAAAASLGVAILPLYIGEPDLRLVRVLAAEVNIKRTYWLTIPRAMEALGRMRAARSELQALVAAHPYLEALA